MEDFERDSESKRTERKGNEGERQRGMRKRTVHIKEQKIEARQTKLKGERGATRMRAELKRERGTGLRERARGPRLCLAVKSPLRGEGVLLLHSSTASSLRASSCSFKLPRLLFSSRPDLAV